MRNSLYFLVVLGSNKRDCGEETSEAVSFVRQRSKAPAGTNYLVFDIRLYTCTAQFYESFITGQNN